MNYTEPSFLVFLFLVASTFYLLPVHRRATFLTLASFVFYAWSSYFDAAVFLLIVFLIWLVTYLKAPVWSAISILLLHLGFWKYGGWFCKDWPYALPLGISFITLQGIGYLVDYHRGHYKQLTFKELLLFKSFFGQLIAGPITRAGQLVPQLRNLENPSKQDLLLGFLRFAQGYFKKVWIANSMAPLVDSVFAAPESYSTLSLLSAVLAYAVQIWGDFSGYTDMGLGAARLIGIRLPENFRSPYFAVSLSDFWRRWHITLGLFIRDYLYLPLGGRTGSPAKQCAVLLFCFTLSGLWHGAGFTFVLWGFYHGFMLWLERNVGEPKPKTVSLSVARFFTLFVVLFGWILFRSETLAHWGRYLHALFIQPGTDTLAYLPIGVALLTTWILHWQPELPESIADFATSSWRTLLLCLGTGLFIAGLIIARPMSEVSPFIYFQF